MLLGYDEDSAHVTASNLQNENKYPLVVGRINELSEKEKDYAKQGLCSRNCH